MKLNNKLRTKLLLGLLILVGVFDFLEAITSSITLFYINQLFNGVEGNDGWFEFMEI